MNYENNLLSKLLPKLNFGRQKIFLDYDEVTPENVSEVLGKAIPYHQRNKKDCEYLINYFLGGQDILKRPAPSTSNINNQVVINSAFAITREVVGYTYGNPIEYIQNDVGKQSEVEKLSDIYDNAGSYLTDIITAFYDSICGVGYQITLPSKDISENYVPDVPITIESLDPRDTFVVFSTTSGNAQIMSCNIIHTESKGDIYQVYTDKYMFELDDGYKLKSYSVNPMEIDPITMFDNSIFLTGDWEQAISVMNASNVVASDSLNDIEGAIRSLLVLIGAEFDDDEKGLAQIKDKRMLTLVSPTGSNVDAKFISPKLESSSIENLRQYLEDVRNIITGIPDRQTASGGDTGTAVLNRNGWTDIEIVAKLKELFFKKAKKKQLAVGIKILQLLGKVSDSLSPLNINVTIGRHTNDNIQTKAQAFSTLVATGELATIDALEMSGLTNRVNEVVKRGEEKRKERQEEAIATMKSTGNADTENEDTSKEEDKEKETGNTDK